MLWGKTEGESDEPVNIFMTSFLLSLGFYHLRNCSQGFHGVYYTEIGDVVETKTGGLKNTGHDSEERYIELYE